MVRGVTPLLQTLERLHLLRRAPEDPVLGRADGARGLLQLCDAGLLDGGLAVAYGVRPDEVLGPLLMQMGGRAARLKVEDVREAPALTLHVVDGGEHVTWEVPDVEALVDALNRHFARERGVRAVALLGEWQDARMLWCVPRPALAALSREPSFRPLNAPALAPRSAG